MSLEMTSVQAKAPPEEKDMIPAEVFEGGYSATAMAFDNGLKAFPPNSEELQADGYCVSTCTQQKYLIPPLDRMTDLLNYVSIGMCLATPILDVEFLIGMYHLGATESGFYILFALTILIQVISGLAQVFFPGGLLSAEKIWPNIGTGGLVGGGLGMFLGVLFTVFSMGEGFSTLYRYRGHYDAWQLPQNFAFVQLGVEGIAITIISCYLSLNVEGSFQPSTFFEYVVLIKVFVTGVAKNGWALYKLDTCPVALGYRFGRIRPVIHDPTRWFGTWPAVGFPNGVGEFFTPVRMRTDIQPASFKTFCLLFCVFIVQAHCLGVPLAAVTMAELTGSLAGGLGYAIGVGVLMVIWMVLCVCACNMTCMFRTALVMWPMSLIVNIFEYAPVLWGTADPNLAPTWMYYLGGLSAPVYVVCVYGMWKTFKKDSDRHVNVETEMRQATQPGNIMNILDTV